METTQTIYFLGFDPNTTCWLRNRGKVKLIDRIRQFLREVKIELKRVTWPSRKDTIGSTSVVLIVVIIIAVFLGLVDMGLSRLVRTILG